MFIDLARTSSSKASIDLVRNVSGHNVVVSLIAGRKTHIAIPPLGSVDSQEGSDKGQGFRQGKHRSTGRVKSVSKNGTERSWRRKSEKERDLKHVSRQPFHTKGPATKR
jgi:hypothetical protein